MRGIGDNLTSEDIKFLEKYFQIWNPLTGLHSNFNCLGRSIRVLLYGESHHSPSQQKIQNLFLKRFATPEDCLLVEGFPPLCDLPRTHCTPWPDLPEKMTVKGSDIRVANREAEMLDYRCKSNAHVGVYKRTQKKIKEEWKNCITLLNSELAAERAFIEDGEVQVTSEALNKVLEILNRIETYKKELVQSRNTIRMGPDTQFDEQSKWGAEFQVSESNQELANCITKLVELPKTQAVMALWGSSHYTTASTFYTKLEEAKITYCVLLPNAKYRRKARSEASKPKSVPLSVLSQDPKDRRSYTLHFPVTLVRFFDAPLQPFLQSQHKSSKIWINAEWIQGHSNGVFPANAKLCFTELQVDENDLGSLPFNTILQRLNPLYLTAGKRLSFNLSPIECHYNIRTDLETCRKFLQIRSPDAIPFKVQDLILTKLEDLWNYMQRRRLFAYHVPANRPFVIPSVEGDFSKIIDLFNHTLVKSLPLHKAASLTEGVVIEPCKLNGEAFNAIHLSSDQGFAIVLVPKAFKRDSYKLACKP